RILDDRHSEEGTTVLQKRDGFCIGLKNWIAAPPSDIDFYAKIARGGWNKGE
ncbi:hypothetical protein BG000_003325, partial [Podila horticola]